MSGCFGNHWVDRQIEREVMRYCDTDDCGEDCCTCEERCESACDGCKDADNCAAVNVKLLSGKE